MREIANDLVKSGCYVKNESKITTTCGDEVIAYLCCRLAISNVEIRRKIIKELSMMLKNKYGNDITIAGMATAGIPWATGVAEELSIPMLYLRSKPKEYGLSNLIEGNLEYVTKRIVVMDDVLYTGQTAKKGINALKERGYEVVAVSTIVKLSDQAELNFKKDNIDVCYLTDYNEILDAAFDEKIINDKDKKVLLKLYRSK